MKKTLLFITVLFATISISAQSYRGFHSSNYAGVHGMISNPSSITTSKLNYDINFVSFDALLSNSVLEVDLSDIQSLKNPTLGSDSNLLIDAQLLGPSVFFRLNSKSALGIHTKARVMANFVDFDSELIDQVSSNFDGNTGFRISEDNGFSSIQHAWAEIGATYARDLWNTKKHKISGGMGLKYLSGAIAAGLSSDGLTLIGDGVSNVLINGNIGYKSDTDLIGSSDVVQNIQDSFGEARGIGADIGFTYLLKDTSTAEDDYTLKLGASVTDIGKVDYKLENTSYEFTNVFVTENEINEIGESQTLTEFLEDKSTSSTNTGNNQDTEIGLPTQLHINADVKLTDHLFLNANSSISLTDSKNKFVSSALTHYTITPRFESSFIGLWSPVGLDEFDNFTWGAGLRFGPVFIGSGSILSSLISDTKILDLYGGLKLPIIQTKRKDTDGDGILDRNDLCKKVPGIPEKMGCPPAEKAKQELENVVLKKDSDDDGVMDEDDDCPQKAGTKENNGCPIADKDKDGIPDDKDKCPEEAGEVTNNGCPLVDEKDDKDSNEVSNDKDGDKIADDKDACPNVAGSVANNGCPITLKEVEAFRQDVREIYFNSGSSLVNLNSAERLKSAMKVMNKFPDIYWIIEGHTDSAGSAYSNQRLSEARAESVKLFFIKNGIEQSKISSMGYGELRPQTTNATANGRAKNRRVEIRAADKLKNLVGLDLPEKDIATEMSNLAKFIYFETGSNIIIDNSKAQLDLIAYYIKKFEGNYEIQGHTDSVGAELNNLKLSQRRANAVVDYLINKGVKIERVRAMGYGESRPVADNSTKDGQAENRRIEIRKDAIGSGIIKQKIEGEL
jgi:outer membrane protein OmpA-like peptidoglycan-associated protein